MNREIIITQKQRHQSMHYCSVTDRTNFKNISNLQQTKFLSLILPLTWCPLTWSHYIPALPSSAQLWIQADKLQLISILVLTLSYVSHQLEQTGLVMTKLTITHLSVHHARWRGALTTKSVVYLQQTKNKDTDCHKIVFKYRDMTWSHDIGSTFYT